MEKSAPGSTLVDVFLTCLGTAGPQGDQLDRLRLSEWQQLLQMGQHNLVPGLLNLKIDRVMGGRALPEDIRQALREQVRQTAVLNMQQTGEALAVLNGLAAAGVDAILLKGAYLRLGIYPIPAMRTMSDLDLLVKEADLKRAEAALLESGYDPTPDLAGSLGIGHISYHPRSGKLPVEIHWQLQRVDDHFHRIPTEDLWDRSIPVDISGIPGRGLADEDLLLYLCFHGASRHYFRLAPLRSLCDIRQIIQQHGERLDWDMVTRRAAAWQITNSLALSLHLASRLLGTQLPQGFLENLPQEERLNEIVEFTEGQIRAQLVDSPPQFALFWQELLRDEAPGGRWLALRRAIFPGKSYVVNQYHVSYDSWKIYWLGAFDLLRRTLRHLRYGLLLWLGNPEMRQEAAQAEKLAYYVKMVQEQEPQVDAPLPFDPR